MTTRKLLQFNGLSKLFVAALFASGLVLGGCQPADEEAPAGEEAATQEAAPSEAAPSEAAPTGDQAFAVSGMVKYDGPQPKRQALRTEADPYCHEMYKDDPLLAQIEVVSEEGDVKWAFVYVKNPPEKDYPMPDAPAVLDQNQCRYDPHILGMRAGQELEIVNSDATLHNVRSFAEENRPFNIGQPADTPPRTKTYDEPEMAVKVRCDVHPWMLAYLFVMDHPYYAVTDENGEFTIPDLPPGTYTLVSWHEKYGEQEQEITVADGAVTDITYTYQPQ